MSRSVLIKAAVLASVSLVAAVVFQNCTAAGFMAIQSPPYQLSYGHPSLDSSNTGPAVSGHILVGDRDYLESVFSDVFTTSNSSADIKGYVQTVLFQEFAPEQQMLGRGCDPVQDGDSHLCNYNLSNTDVAMQANSSAIREAAAVQVCRRLLANDSVLSGVIARVNASQGTPDDASVAAAIRLFFPANDNALQVKTALLQMDQAMAQAAETAKDRWRILLLTLCESPAWQVL